MLIPAFLRDPCLEYQGAARVKVRNRGALPAETSRSPSFEGWSVVFEVGTRLGRTRGVIRMLVCEDARVFCFGTVPNDIGKAPNPWDGITAKCAGLVRFAPYSIWRKWESSEISCHRHERGRSLEVNWPHHLITPEITVPPPSPSNDFGNWLPSEAG